MIKVGIDNHARVLFFFSNQVVGKDNRNKIFVKDESIINYLFHILIRHVWKYLKGRRPLITQKRNHIPNQNIFRVSMIFLDNMNLPNEHNTEYQYFIK